MFQIITHLVMSNFGCKISDQIFVGIGQAGVSDGDMDGPATVKDAFSLLNQNDVLFKPTSDTGLLYLYRQLAHRTIILESVTKNLPDDEESDG